MIGDEGVRTIDKAASSEVLRLNYYALVVSILGNCIPETAFEKVQSEKPSAVRNQITKDDYKDMMKLREQGLLLKDLGDIYCMNHTIISRNLKKLKDGSGSTSKKGDVLNGFNSRKTKRTAGAATPSGPITKTIQ